MAKWQKGESGNISGRPKNTPNKTTDQLRSAVQTFFEKNWEQVQTDFDSMEPKDRLAFLERLLKHVLPPVLNDLERLSPEQLDEIINKIKTGKYQNYES